MSPSMRRTCAFMLSGCAVLAPNARAQEQLGVEQYLEIVLRAHPGAAERKGLEQAAEAEGWPARLLPDPVFGATWDHARPAGAGPTSDETAYSLTSAADSTDSPPKGSFAGKWRFELQLGYTLSGGAVSRSLGDGFGFGLSVGRRTVGDVLVEAAASLGNVDYADAQTVTGWSCVPVVRAVFNCSQRPVLQRGHMTALALGLEQPLRTDAKGRAIRVGAGAIWERYEISPAASEGSESRSGPGFYVVVSGDLVPIGTIASIGLQTRGAMIFSTGDALGGSLPRSTTDRWLDVRLYVTLGRGSRSAHKTP